MRHLATCAFLAAACSLAFAQAPADVPGMASLPRSEMEPVLRGFDADRGALMRAFPASDSPEHAARLRAYYESTLAGLDAIEAELARDDTATGRRRAAFARASRPTPAAKELAWADVMDRTDLPNAMLEATMGGFVQPEQLDLLRPYRTRYFQDLPRVWAQRTMEMAQDITSTLYPFLLVDDQTLRLTDEYLARTDLAAAQRRLLIEGRDAVVRAQRAQARDAS